MDENSTLTRSQKLGMALASHRENTEKTIVKTAAHLGITPDELLRFENGEASPSLPQLELLSDFYRIPMPELLSGNEAVNSARKIDPEKIPALVGIRTRIIAALLRNTRTEQNLSAEEMAANLGITPAELDLYETGKTQVPLHLLETACEKLNIPLESLILDSGPKPEVAPDTKLEPAVEEPAVEEPTLPVEIAEFVKEPANLPFIKLAQALSKIDPAALNQLAEGLKSLEQD